MQTGGQRRRPLTESYAAAGWVGQRAQVYIIDVCTTTNSWTVCRRFSEFDALHQKVRARRRLSAAYPSRLLTQGRRDDRATDGMSTRACQLKKRFGRLPRDLPKKIPTLKMNASALQDRTRNLNEYLSAIMEREPRILQSEEFYGFLEVHFYVRSACRARAGRNASWPDARNTHRVHRCAEQPPVVAPHRPRQDVYAACRMLGANLVPEGQGAASLPGT